MFPQLAELLLLSANNLTVETISIASLGLIKIFCFTLAMREVASGRWAPASVCLPPDGTAGGAAEIPLFSPRAALASLAENDVDPAWRHHLGRFFLRNENQDDIAGTFVRKLASHRRQPANQTTAPTEEGNGWTEG